MKTPRSLLRTRCLFLLLFLSVQGLASAAIQAELFDPDFPEGDSNYHSLTAASDGRIYFTIGTHHKDFSARFFAFDPGTDEVREVARMNDVVMEDRLAIVPHGKIHTPLIEHDGHLYFSTHTSTYDGNLPDIVPDDGRTPYPGGYFMRYALATGEFERLAQIPLKNEGLITMAMDKERDLLVALTWPSGILFTYDIMKDELQQFGATQGRGEWGRLGADWSFICRRLGIDDDGNVYGSDNNGRIWKFATGNQRPVEVIGGMSLDAVPPVAEADFAITDEPHFFWRNWRTILWNPRTESFWGLHGGSTQLFEFSPAEGSLRSVHNLRADSIPMSRRNPYRTQLGLTLGPDNTLFYFAHGPAMEKPGRPNPTANVHLITYAIDSGTFTDHGPVMGPDDRRVFFTESIEIAQDGHLYSVAWVEVLDPQRMAHIQESRGDALPAETRDVIYEIQLIRLPKAATFAGE